MIAPFCGCFKKSCEGKIGIQSSLTQRPAPQRAALFYKVHTTNSRHFRKENSCLVIFLLALKDGDLLNIF